jgi:protein-S-isoprenylcysteine O-methyltransferase Ste14
MRTSIWDLIFLVGFIVYTGIRGVFKQRTAKVKSVARRLDAVEKALLALVIPGSLLWPLLYLFTPWLRFADYELPLFFPWVGLVMMVGSLWLFYRSHADLGRQWSVTLELREDHRLIKQGVYRRMRHPMYASIWLWCIAQGLLLANWLAGWYALVAFAVMYFIRTPREERMLCEAFGAEYVEYMSQTGRLFPRRRRKSGE